MDLEAALKWLCSQRGGVSADILQKERFSMPTKIDPLNKKQYGAVSAMLTVTDLKAAVEFYHNAFGFTKRAILNGPDGKPMHAELTLRDTTLMLGPENPSRGALSARTIGGSPLTLYLLTEDVDTVVARALKLGATSAGPVTDMFWGDRCGNIIDPEGNTWMIATHTAEPSEQEMKKRMAEQTSTQTAGAGSGF
jgi:PhnB protein